jgi:TolB-like protein/AraC-like DNA-binding protein
MSKEFIKRLTDIVEANLANEKFGVEDLIREMGLSHSNLHRKLKSISNQTISQFIREIRLKKSKEFLLNEDLTISEISYRVGFGSPTYFNKCFHEYFGYAPGEFKRQENQSDTCHEPNKTLHKKKNLKVLVKLVGPIILLILVSLFFSQYWWVDFFSEKEKSIAVLPVKYMGNDPNKQYMADGLQDAILLHLSKIADLRVMSRTSTEQYRDTKKTARKICQEQKVDYLFESSLLVIGDSIQLIAQLIEPGRKERHIWAGNFLRDKREILTVQNEVAQSIANELNARIGQEERQRIERFPTLNLTAYDFYQKAREELWEYRLDKKKTDMLKSSEYHYRQALLFDPQYAEAYSGLASIYWEKNFIHSYLSNSFIDSSFFFANKALKLDDQLAEAYKVRGDYFMETGKPEQAIQEFSQAIKINPNCWEAYAAMGFLYEFKDAVIAISNYIKAASLHRGRDLPRLLAAIGNCFFWAGFPKEHSYYGNEVFKLTRDSVIYFLNQGFIEDYRQNWHGKLAFFLKAHQIDTSNTTVISGLGLTYIFLHQYDKALETYQKLLVQLEKSDLLSYNEMHRIGYAFWMNGFKEKANYYFDKQIELSTKGLDLQRINNPFLHYDLAGVYAFRGEKGKAYEQLNLFMNSIKWKHSWIIILIQNDPLFDRLRSEPRFQAILNEIISEHQAEHDRVSKWLKNQKIM